MKVLVVSDYSLAKLGGAQVIAEIVRDSLTASGHEAIFLEYPQTRRVNRNLLQQSIKSLINPYGVLLLNKAIRRNRPDLIWFHGVNNQWSWISLKVGKRGLTRIVTIHDLSAVSNYKITPEILEMLKLETGMKKIARNTRHKIVKKCLQLTINVGIGETNTRILRSFGFRIDKEIENRIEPCSHTAQIDKVSRTVLFAGRQYMKGLPQVAQAVAADKRWRLVLAGDLQLMEEALLYCPEDQVTYLGRLQRGQLLKTMHEMSLVSVCSQYYDNFPTVALEALVHNSIPFTTELTGVAPILNRIDARLVIKASEVPNLEEIYKVENLLGQNYIALKRQLSNLNQFVPRYLELMHSDKRGKL